MHRAGQKPEIVSKKKSDFFLMGECFFLTYFLIGEPEAIPAEDFGDLSAAFIPILLDSLWPVAGLRPGGWFGSAQGRPW